MDEEIQPPAEETELDTPRRLSRRRVVSGLAIASAATGVAAYQGYGPEPLTYLAARARIAASRLTDHLREELSERQLTPRQALEDEADYRTFLTGLPLRYLTPDDIIRPHRNVRKGVANKLPPRHMWSRLIPTLKVADEIRHRLGSPLRHVNSAYRSPDYNLACSGAKYSFHMQNLALDLTFREGAQAASAVAKELRNDGFFRGGIGTYSSFIHIDTRGFDAIWEV